MFSLYGYNENVKNICLLAKPYMGGDVNSIDSLRTSYLKFLSKHQPHQTINTSDRVFIDSDEVEVSLKRSYEPSALDDLQQFKMVGGALGFEDKLATSSVVADGLDKLMDSSTEIKNLFRLAIHSIFFRASSHEVKMKSFGGSSSTAMGVIWISGHGEKTSNDFAEFLLHEVTHHLLFIDERCHQQFTYSEMLKKENFAISALLKIPRPLDKVVHSIVVATEILLARMTFLKPINITIHPNSSDLRESTLASVKSVLSMKNIENVISDRTISILENCDKHLAQA